MNNSFPRTITILRKEKKLSQKDAARELGISQALLSHYEKGIRECGLDFIIKLSDFYNVSCDFLLGKTSVKKDSPIKVKKQKSSDTDEETKDIINALKLVSEISRKFGSTDLHSCVISYFRTCIYKIFRILYGANGKNPAVIFSKDKKTYMTETLCDTVTYEKKIKCLSSGESVYKLTAAEKANIPLLSPDTIAEEFPEYADSLFSVIKEYEIR